MEIGRWSEVAGGMAGDVAANPAGQGDVSFVNGACFASSCWGAELSEFVPLSAFRNTVCRPPSALRFSVSERFLSV